MTPEERAKNIVADLASISDKDRESYIEQVLRSVTAVTYEDAARIADDVTDTTRLKTSVVLLGRDIASAIRDRAKETEA